MGDVSLDWSSDSDTCSDSSEDMGHEARNDTRMEDWSFEACPDEDVHCRKIRGQHPFLFDPS